ncbi:MAG: flagellar basal body P-ring formation chaperone FlgA [Thermodesulfobacteriota bacterium]
MTRQAATWLATALLLVGTSLTARAATLDADTLRQVFTALVLENAAPPRDELVIERFSAQPAELAIPDGEIGYRPHGNLPPGETGQKVLTVTVTVDGADAGVVRLSGDVARYRPVVALRKRIGRHTVLRAEDLCLVRKNLALLGDSPLTDPGGAVGKRLRVSQGGGAVLTAAMLETVPLVQRGDVVTILADGGRFRVTAPGIVRNAGRRGDMVQVKNMMSRRLIFARVEDEQTVVVDY